MTQLAASQTDTDQAAQLAAWQHRHADTPRRSAYWTIDAREADHAEALQIDKGYLPGHLSRWYDKVHRRAVEMNPAAPHMGHAYDSLIDEAHAEALQDDAAYRQNAEYRHRMQWQKTVDEDHTEALLSNQPLTTPATAEEVAFVARQMDAMNTEDTTPAPEIVIPASGKTPYCATCCADLGEDHDEWCGGSGVVALTATRLAHEGPAT